MYLIYIPYLYLLLFPTVKEVITSSHIISASRIGIHHQQKTSRIPATPNPNPNPFLSSRAARPTTSNSNLTLQHSSGIAAKSVIATSYNALPDTCCGWTTYAYTAKSDRSSCWEVSLLLVRRACWVHWMYREVFRDVPALGLLSQGFGGGVGGEGGWSSACLMCVVREEGSPLSACLVSWVVQSLALRRLLGCCEL